MTGLPANAGSAELREGHARRTRAQAQRLEPTDVERGDAPTGERVVEDVAVGPHAREGRRRRAARGSDLGVQHVGVLPVERGQPQRVVDHVAGQVAEVTDVRRDQRARDHAVRGLGEHALAQPEALVLGLPRPRHVDRRARSGHLREPRARVQRGHRGRRERDRCVEPALVRREPAARERTALRCAERGSGSRTGGTRASRASPSHRQRTAIRSSPLATWHAPTEPGGGVDRKNGTSCEPSPTVARYQVGAATATAALPAAALPTALPAAWRAGRASSPP